MNRARRAPAPRRSTSVRSHACTVIKPSRFSRATRSRASRASASSSSTPTQRQPLALAASTSTRPSPHPRSYRTSEDGQRARVERDGASARLRGRPRGEGRRRRLGALVVVSSGERGAQQRVLRARDVGGIVRVRVFVVAHRSSARSRASSIDRALCGRETLFGATRRRVESESESRRAIARRVESESESRRAIARRVESRAIARRVESRRVT